MRMGITALRLGKTWRRASRSCASLGRAPLARCEAAPQHELARVAACFRGVPLLQEVWREQDRPGAGAHKLRQQAWMCVRRSRGRLAHLLVLAALLPARRVCCGISTAALHCQSLRCAPGTPSHDNPLALFARSATPCAGARVLGPQAARLRGRQNHPQHPGAYVRLRAWQVCVQLRHARGVCVWVASRMLITTIATRCCMLTQPAAHVCASTEVPRCRHD